jgi:hypothetical protein
MICAHTLIQEQAMTRAIKSSSRTERNVNGKPSYYELNEQELDRVSGGGTKSATKGSAAGCGVVPHENISINFSSLSMTYNQQG